MEMKYILYSKVHTTKEAGDSWTFKFQPVEGRFKKEATFSITTTDPFQDMGVLDLPQTIGDIITLGKSSTWNLRAVQPAVGAARHDRSR